MLIVSEEAFIVNRGGGDDVSTWLEGTPGHIKSGSFGRDFPLSFISSKRDGECRWLQYLYLLLSEHYV